MVSIEIFYEILKNSFVIRVNLIKNLYLKK